LVSEHSLTRQKEAPRRRLGRRGAPPVPLLNLQARRCRRRRLHRRMHVCKDSAAPAHARTRAHRPAAPRHLRNIRAPRPASRACLLCLLPPFRSFIIVFLPPTNICIHIHIYRDRETAIYEDCVNQSKVRTKPHTGKEKPHPGTTTEGALPLMRACACFARHRG